MNSKWYFKSQVKRVKTILTINFDNMEIVTDINKSNYTLRDVCQEIIDREEVVSLSGDNFFKRIHVKGTDKWDQTKYVFQVDRYNA